MRVFGKSLNNIKSASDQLATKSKKGAHQVKQKTQYKFDKKLQKQHQEQRICLQQLEKQEVNLSFAFTIQSLNMREKLFKWLVAQCRLTLELKNQTIEHCMRLFDKYYAKVGTLSNNLSEGQLTLVACLFISSKYEQVYPPVLSDFEYVAKYKFNGKEILAKQVQILQKVQYEISIALASSFYYLMFKETIPDWAILCYTNLPLNVRMKSLALAIYDAQRLYKLCENNKLSEQSIEKMVNSVIEALQTN